MLLRSRVAVVAVDDDDAGAGSPTTTRKRTVAQVHEEHDDDDDNDAAGSPLPLARRQREAKLRRIGRWWDATCPQDILTRDKITDWLAKLTGHFGLQVLTLDATISYFDRVINNRDSVEIADFQRIACACLLFACKREERCEKVPFLRDLCAATDNSLVDNDILKEELRSLYELEWRLEVPSPVVVLDRFYAILTNTARPVPLPPDEEADAPPPPPVSPTPTLQTEAKTQYRRAADLLEKEQHISPCSNGVAEEQLVRRLRSLTWRAARAYYSIVVLEDHEEWTPAHVDAFGYTEEMLVV